MSTDALLQVRDLRVVFRLGGGLLTPKRDLVAVNGVSFEIAAGETLAVVGESGSGKSTIARAVMRLVEPESGSVMLDGHDLTALRGEALRRVRPKLQMVFQDPYSSLDPSKLIRDTVAEPLLVHGRMGGDELERKVLALLEQVGLGAYHMNRYPYEFSGGQRQRIAIARAIALEPRLLVLDEAVSALDVSTQNQILNLLEDLRRERQIAYLFISHDLGIVARMADEVAIMYAGRIVEFAAVAALYEEPRHPYTIGLMRSLPRKRNHLEKRQPLEAIPGMVPDLTRLPRGCRYQDRCGWTEDRCRQEEPPLLWFEDAEGLRRASACWRHNELCTNTKPC